MQETKHKAIPGYYAWIWTHTYLGRIIVDIFKVRMVNNVTTRVHQKTLQLSVLNAFWSHRLKHWSTETWNGQISAHDSIHFMTIVDGCWQCHGVTDRHNKSSAQRVEVGMCYCSHSFIGNSGKEPNRKGRSRVLNYRRTANEAKYCILQFHSCWIFLLTTFIIRNGGCTSFNYNQRRQNGRVGWAPDLKSGGPGFKSRSEH